jgi:hypothetical protein
MHQASGEDNPSYATIAKMTGINRSTVIPTATLLEHTLLTQGFMGTSKAAFPYRLRPRNRDSTWANLANALK